MNFLDKLRDKESKEGIHRILDLFIDDLNADIRNLSLLKSNNDEINNLKKY